MNANRDTVELWGREFNIVKSGLSEAQVVAFVDGLVKEHDALLQRQEHLAALSKLAERTVAEADKMADEVKKEAADSAKAEAAKIMTEAENRARNEATKIIAEAEALGQRLVKEKEAEIMTTASQQAEAVKSGAERLAAEIKREAEARAKVETVRILAEAEAQGQQIIKDKQAAAISIATERAEAIKQQAEKEASLLLENEIKRIQPDLVELVSRVREQLLSELESLKSKVDEFDVGLGEIPIQVQERPVGAAKRQAEKPVTTGKREPEKRDEFLELVRTVGETSNGEPAWELEIMPPMDVMKIMGIVTYLDELPEVEKTEIIPRNERSAITVYLREPLNLIDMIKALPEVGHVEEVQPDPDSMTRRLSLALSGKEPRNGENRFVEEGPDIVVPEARPARSKSRN